MVRKLSACLLLVALVARAEEIHQVPAAQAEIVSHPNWVLTPTGMDNIQAALDKQHADLAFIREKDAALEKEITRVSAMPALTPRAVVVLLAVGAVVGAGVAVSICVAAR